MFLKRCFDLCLAMVLCVCLLPLLAFIALFICLSMGRPVLFAQTRIGLKEKPFTIYKFRTMTEGRNDKGELLPDERRLTRLGRIIRRLSLDELPQLVNVIIGNLSFVGPRPLLVEYLPLYSAHQRRRHEVKPGITGWAQVNGRNALTWEEKFDFDVWYVDHWSLGLDAKIVALTIMKVITGQGVNAEGLATMPRFTGPERKGE
jgi:sugar transferase EpsL